jgi:hypothetical protein
MKLTLLAFVALLAAPALAEDTALDGPAILAALTDAKLVYDDGATQVFRAGGATIYDNGRQSSGRWAVREDRYCSSWPPSDTWACYGVTQSPDGQTISFVADDGSTTSGHQVP